MNKKIYKLNISLVPLLVVIALGVGAYYIIRNSGSFSEPKVKRLNGFPNTAVTNETLEKQRRVIKSEDELADFLNYIDKSGYLTVREDINFKTDWVLGISTETFNETGHSIKVRKLYEDKEDGSVLVSLREMVPGANCKVELHKNVAMDLVVISKTKLAIEFERVKQVQECE